MGMSGESGEVKITRVISSYAQPIGLEVSRTQKGTYRWRIEVHGETIDDVLAKVSKLDSELRVRFLGERPTKPGVKEKPKKIEEEGVKAFVEGRKDILELIETSKMQIVKPKAWLGKEMFGEINEALKGFGFEWKPAGEESCWIKEIKAK